MSSETKSIFLYGNPTNKKLEMLIQIQKSYTDKINEFIDIMISDKKYYLDLINNNKKAPLIRELEKSNRGELGSALGQNAIDHAVKELHNLLIRIKNYLYGQAIDSDIEVFVSYKSMLNSCIQNLSYEETLNNLKTLLKNKVDDYNVKLSEYNEKLENAKKKNTKLPNEPKKPNEIESYTNLIKELETLGKEKVEKYINHVNILFNMELNSRKIPFVKKAPVQLDSRLFTLEKSEHVKSDFVINIKKLDSQKKKDEEIRIPIPISTSKNSLRRINQYEKSNTATFSITKNGKLKIGIPFTKKIKEKSKPKDLRGVDIGITDLLFDSEGNSFGSFANVIKTYDTKVLPEQAKINTLRNKMKKYQKELRKKSTPNHRKVALRKKIFNINSMLMKNKSLSRALNSYYHEQDKSISQAVNEYLNSIKSTTTTTVIESLDIKEFNRSKTENRRDSNWARAKLTEKLESVLNWNGFNIIEVDPAYTSQICPKCFNVDKENRKFKTFKCTCCGHEDDADHNGAINIKERAKDKELSKIIEKYKYNQNKRHTEIINYYKNKHNLIKNKITVLQG